MEGSYEQACGFLFKIVVSLKFTIGFVSNFKQFQFRKCKMFFQNFNVIGFVARELHLLEVEGVDYFFFIQIWSK
jgi:hypothetical protein